MRLTAVIITLNEEANLDRCLSSLTGVVDEIIVADSGSVDATKQIALRHGARFLAISWNGYAATKNFANAQARGDYILSVDADEELSPELRVSVLTEKKKGFGSCYIVSRLTYYEGKPVQHGGWYPDQKLRIFPKGECTWVGEFVHETIEAPDSIPRKNLLGHLYHYSYANSLDHRMRADHYSRLTAQKFHAQGRRPLIASPWLHGIGRFVRMYFLKLGFLDGFVGAKIAWISACSNCFKYRELKRLSTVGVKESKPLLGVRKVLLTRTDAIGDVCLSLLMAGYIKRHHPEVEIGFLCSSYTESVVKAYTAIDHVHILPKNEDDTTRLRKDISSYQCAVFLFPDPKVVDLIKSANIPIRIGSAHRLKSFFALTDRVWFSRKNSALHEAQLNFFLLRPLQLFKIPGIAELRLETSWFKPATQELPLEVEKFLTQDSSKVLVLHPKSRGSAVEWGIDHYFTLCNLAISNGWKVVFTGTRAEGEFFSSKVPRHNKVLDLTRTELSLEKFIYFLTRVDGLVAASTGPLHIASFLGKKVVGIYVPRRPLHPERWGPIGAQAEGVVFDPACEACHSGKNCTCSENITPEVVWQKFNIGRLTE